MTKENQTTEINFIENHGTFMVSSLEIAKHFGKEHKNILRDIENLIQDLPTEIRQLNFELTSITVSMPSNTTRQDQAYNLTRDGFTLLTMSGKKTLEWKVKYIEAFNKIGKDKEELNKINSQDIVSSRRNKLFSQENYFL